MNSQVMFGKAAVAPAKPAMKSGFKRHAAPVEEKPRQPHPLMQAGSGGSVDNLNELDFGRTFASAYAEGYSMIVVFVLWLFFGGMGGHRWYLGNRWVAGAMAGLGTFNGFLWLTGGITAYMSYAAGTGVMSGGLISAIVVMVVHFTWMFFDFFYILVRKFTSR